jgi:hypothetical protein
VVQVVLFRNLLAQGVMRTCTLQLKWKHELRHREIAPTKSAHLFKDPPDPGASESLDGVIFAFFHLGLIPCGAVHLDDGDRLASMNHIWSDRVAVQVLNGLDCNR